MNSLEVKDLAAGYQGQNMIEEIDFSCQQGEKIGVLGPNGAGKSTLLKALAGLIKSKGQIKIMGQEYKKPTPLIAYLSQQLELDWDFPATVLAVVLMGRYPYYNRFGPKESDRVVALKALEQVGLLDYQQRSIKELSGGERQRVFLARALAQEAEILLLDEPFNGVDATTEQILHQLLNQLALKRTLIIVHHNLVVAKEFFDRIFLLNKQLITTGRTEEVLVNRYLQEAYGSNYNFEQLSVI